MKDILTTLVALMMATLPAAQEDAGFRLEPFSLTVTPDLRTAYVSRSKVVEDRPVASVRFRGDVEIGPFGKFGLWQWSRHSLSGHRQNMTRRAFTEDDYAMFWHYDLDIAEKWRLSNELTMDWITLPGFHGEAQQMKKDASMVELRVDQSLSNPYVTPFWQMRHAIHPTEWMHVQAGVRRRFRITEDVSIIPSTFMGTGNETMFEQRFGQRDGGRRYHRGIMTLNAELLLEWRICSHVAAFASLNQYDVASEDGRRGISGQRHPKGRRDLTYGTCGLRISF
jgi:hypothetical protein